MQRLGMDAKKFFADNRDLSLINVSDALAFQVLCMQAGLSNAKDYSPDKLREKYLKHYGVSPHAKTIKKYVYVLVKIGFCVIEGSFLRFKSVKSHNNDRNYDILLEDGLSVKTVGREIAMFIFSSSMRSIGYIKDLLQRRENPQNNDELMYVRRRLRRLGFDRERFKDNGVTYDLLCDRYNISRPTCSSFIKKCEQCGIFKKNPRKEHKVIRNVSRKFSNADTLVDNLNLYYEGEYTYFSYSSKFDTLCLFKVYANQYDYNPNHLCFLNY